MAHHRSGATVTAPAAAAAAAAAPPAPLSNLSSSTSSAAPASSSLPPPSSPSVVVPQCESPVSRWLRAHESAALSPVAAHHFASILLDAVGCGSADPALLSAQLGVAADRNLSAAAVYAAPLLALYPALDLSPPDPRAAWANTNPTKFISRADHADTPLFVHAPIIRHGLSPLPRTNISAVRLRHVHNMFRHRQKTKGHTNQQTDTQSILLWETIQPRDHL
jgi:hypothetical protein